ncbi:hypothetical protein JYU34_017129 [Plutella xylostella]|uniref:Uncharacterized protein n=1 Tax=Plutella xylostella TaxID=51655 RepID=A0ABQ7Q0F4_PLUXY|nr:hypothetical protein JYU34_017129 [Plutella xylostella]
MASAAVILILLLANRLKEAQTSVTSLLGPERVNALPEYSRGAHAFALQIEEIRTASEASPAAGGGGNNLNVIPATVPARLLEVTSENFQAISANYPVEENTNKKYNSAAYAVKSDLSFYEKVTKRPRKRKSEVNQEKDVTPIALVWDNCFETVYRNNEGFPKERQYDMEYGNHNFVSDDASKKKTYFNDGVKKRDARNTTKTTTMQMWLDKYISLRDAEERRQFKPDSIIKKPSEVSSTTVKVVPITTELTPVRPVKKVFNVSLDFPVTENNNIKASYTEDWFETKDKVRKTKIKFGGLPQRETYLVPGLKLEEGFHPFGFIADMFYFIHPFDFPVGLVKEILWGKFTFPYSFLLSIKVESAFLVFIILFACLALVIPSYLVIISLLALLGGSRCDDEMESGALFPELEESECNERVLVVATLFVVLVSCALISGMVVANEQATAAASLSRDALRCAGADLAAWLASAARDLHHSLVPPVDLVLQAYRDDTRNVDPLLGEPIQTAICSESGIDLVLESLNDVITESEDLAGKISSLRDVSIQAGSLATAASDRMKDLARQLDNLKKHCVGKDVKLCDTLNTNSMELRMKFDLILREQQLLELRTLGVENLTRAIALARRDFRSLPASIAEQTSDAREDLVRDLENRKELVYRSSRVLHEIARQLTAALTSAVRAVDAGLARVQVVLHEIARQVTAALTSTVRSVDAGLARVQVYDTWRWVAMMGKEDRAKC